MNILENEIDKKLENNLTCLNSITNRYTENTYKHSESNIKDQCRGIIYKALQAMFPNLKKLSTLTLGGENLVTENFLSKIYNLSGTSYESNLKSFETAKKNAPKGVNIINGNIFNHVYNGEQFIWFDLMSCLRPVQVTHIIKWIRLNPIKNDCVFAITYTLHSRTVKGGGYRQLFGTDEKHNEYMNKMAWFIQMRLENKFVSVEKFTKVTYCNTDISKKSLPMVQFVFTLRKNN